MRMKYIMVELEHRDAGLSIAPILFPDVINHVDMWEGMQRTQRRAKLIAAGFVEIYTKDGAQETSVHCFGESESLSRHKDVNKSRGEEDAVIIKMVTQGWTCSNPEYIEKMKGHYK